MLYLESKITFLYAAKSLIKLAPLAGFEPATNRLTGNTSVRGLLNASPHEDAFSGLLALWRAQQYV